MTQTIADILNATKVVKTENTAAWQDMRALPTLTGGDKYDIQRGETCRHETFIVIEARIAKYRGMADRKPACGAAADVLEKFLSDIAGETAFGYWKRMAEAARDITDENAHDYIPNEFNRVY